MQKGHYDSAPVKPDGKKDFGAVKPNGTGPYKITEVKPGDSIMMEKNTAYFKDGFKGDPKISKIKFRTIKDGNTRTAELMTGAIDWMWDVPKDQAERIKANPAIVVENAKTLRVAYLAFDVQGASGQKFFTDKRVRQAIAHAIDREAITKNLVGPGLGGRSTPRAIPTSSPARATCPSTPTIPPRPRPCWRRPALPTASSSTSTPIVNASSPKP